jgi:serine/threonine protein phosphatase 1
MTWLKPRAPKPPPEVHAPRVFLDESIGYAIGDVHGRADLLERLLDRLEREALEYPARRMAIFMGDYIDRGPQSRRVLDILASGRPFGFERRFLIGNHEQMMLRFLADPIGGRGWLGLGGATTLASYGVTPPTLTANAQELQHAAALLAERLPESHRLLLTSLERMIELGSYLFVHAGIAPGKALSQQTDSDLLWIREPFLTSKRALPLCVVHGHTPVHAPTANRQRIAVDTGAYATGLLTAARLEGAGASFVTQAL